MLLPKATWVVAAVGVRVGVGTATARCPAARAVAGYRAGEGTSTDKGVRGPAARHPPALKGEAGPGTVLELQGRDDAWPAGSAAGACGTS